MPSLLVAYPSREVPALSCARYSITNCPSCSTTAGLKVPADSHPVPDGDRIGCSEARVQGPNGTVVTGALRKLITAKPKHRTQMKAAPTRIRIVTSSHRGGHAATGAPRLTFICCPWSIDPDQISVPDFTLLSLRFATCLLVAVSLI